MSRPPLFVTFGARLPQVESPFAVLLDADDPEWGDSSRLRALGGSLLEAGCRYFVCFGKDAESLHDALDDIVVESHILDVMTTYHDTEDDEDVAEFFRTVAAAQMKDAIVLARDARRWASLLSPWRSEVA